jgi:VRR-NUC domain
MKVVTAARQMSEQELLDCVVELSHVLGFKVAHFRAARTAHGWRTPVAADGAGWPDLTIVGRGRVIFAELKAERGRTSDEQKDWLAWLSDAGATATVWRSADWLDGTIESVLRRGS